MSRALSLVVLAGACHHGSAPAPAPRPDPCDMIDAVLAIDSPDYQKIYGECGDRGRSPRVVEVRAPASLLPPNTTCSGRTFSLFRGEADVRGMIVRIDVSAVGRSWTFRASQYQPNPTVTEEGAIESTQSYCSAMGGFVEWTGAHWRTFVDVERALSSTAPR